MSISHNAIRTAQAKDAAAACAVLRRSIVECCAGDHQQDQGLLDAWLGNKTPANVASWFATPSNYCLVAESEGEVVGVALLTQAGKLSLCYVLPEMLHKGIGKALLLGVEAQARDWGISMLKLHSTGTAREFYARNGYVHAGKEKSCYGLECDFFWKKLNGEAKRYCTCSSE